MHVVQRVLAPLLALLLAVAAVLLALEVGWAAAGRPPLLVPWDSAYDSARDATWASSSTQLVCGGVLAAGLMLLLVALKPRRPRRLALVPRTPAVDAAMTRRGLRTAVREAAVQVDGVAAAAVRLRRRRATVLATSRFGTNDTAAALRDQVRTAVAARLEEIALVRTPRVRATVTARRGSRDR